jgi:hypothetical protein
MSENSMLPPIQQYVGTLEAQRRLRIPAIGRYLPSWLTPETCPITVRARVGRHEQVCLVRFSDDSVSPEVLSGIAAGFQLDTDEGSVEISDLLRFSAGFEEVTIRHEITANRFTMVLPKELHRLGLIPEIGDPLVILAIGDSLELWRIELWNRFKASFAARLPSVIVEAQDRLEEVGQPP